MHKFIFLSKLSLNKVIIIPFIIQTLIITSLILFFTSRNSKVAVDELSHQLLNEISNSIVSKLDNYLKDPHQLNQNITQDLVSELVSMDDKMKIRHYLINKLNQFESVSGMGLALENNEYFDSTREKNSITIGFSSKKNNYTLEKWRVDKSGVGKGSGRGQVRF